MPGKAGENGFRVSNPDIVCPFPEKIGVVVFGKEVLEAAPDPGLGRPDGRPAALEPTTSGSPWQTGCPIIRD